MTGIEKKFGIAIRQERERRGFSQEAFAEQAGVHRTYMSSIELGKVQVSIQVAHQLAEALEIPLSQLWRIVEEIGDQS